MHESTANKNGLSTSLIGSGISLSKASTNFYKAFLPISGLSPFIKHNALPLTNTVLSGLYSYFANISFTSISTSSYRSGSSERSHLFKKTTIDFTPIYLHNKMCSLV